MYRLYSYTYFFVDVNSPENLPSSSFVSVVQTPVPDPVYPGDSVTLMCTVITDTMINDLRVFWISNASEADGHPRIYIHKESTNQCEITSKRTCNYELLKSHVAPGDAGMHYCAVSTCGRIILGNGTILRIGEWVIITTDCAVWKLWNYKSKHKHVLWLSTILSSYRQLLSSPGSWIGSSTGSVSVGYFYSSDLPTSRTP